MRPIRYSASNWYFLVRFCFSLVFPIVFMLLQNIDGGAFDASDGIVLFSITIVSICAALVTAYQWSQSSKIYLELSVLGIVDTRLYQAIIPWDQIGPDFEYFERLIDGEHIVHEEHLRFSVKKHYLLNDLNDTSIVPSVRYNNEVEWINLRIMGPGISKSLLSIKDELQQYRANVSSQ